MAETADGKPAVLVAGGCGFIGRNFVAMLVERNLCSRIRVVDRLMPAMGFLAPDHEAAFGSPSVEYQQGDLSRQAAVDKAFAGATFSYIFNLTYDGIPFGQVLCTLCAWS
jgi:nucleoside-diphosphate-sugar epimerase